jgi:hypothetical protein
LGIQKPRKVNGSRTFSVCQASPRLRRAHHASPPSHRRSSGYGASWSGAKPACLSIRRKSTSIWRDGCSPRCGRWLASLVSRQCHVTPDASPGTSNGHDDTTAPCCACSISLRTTASKRALSHETTTTASALRANATRKPCCALHAADSTSSGPCSEITSATNPKCRTPLDILSETHSGRTRCARGRSRRAAVGWSARTPRWVRLPGRFQPC